MNDKKYICPCCQYVSSVPGCCPICFDNTGDEIPMVEQEQPKACAESMYEADACENCPAISNCGKNVRYNDIACKVLLGLFNQTQQPAADGIHGGQTPQCQ